MFSWISPMAYSWSMNMLRYSNLIMYYSNLHNDIMQSTDSLIIHFFFSFFLCSTACFFIACENPPNKCAKMTRKNILPWKSAGFTRENNPPNLLARKTCHFNSRLACQRSPLPRSKSPRQDKAPNLLPPPPTQLRQRSRREGGEESTRPACASWAGTFTFLWMITYSRITQHIHILHRADKIKYINILL